MGVSKAWQLFTADAENSSHAITLNAAVVVKCQCLAFIHF
jgi:hypothetical protein